MSHSRGGSENVCVNYDTSTALALALASEMLPSWHLSLSLCVLSCLTCLRSLMLSYRAEILEECARWPSVLKDLRECMLVAPPTEWACVAAMTHPPSSEAWWNSTHKHTGLDTSCRLSFSTKLKYVDLFFFLMSRAAGFIISRWWDIWNSSADCIITVYGYLHRGIEQAP